MSPRLNGSKTPQRDSSSLHHDYFRAIPFRRLAHLLDDHHVDVATKRWLVAGCGKGTDLRYLAEMTTGDWTAVDISPSALHTTAEAHPKARVLEADLERLPFDDDEFDVGFTAATLHHLHHPMLGLYELMRVSRETTIVIEPHDSWLTRLATRIGAAHEYEVAGNYVYRLSLSDAHRLGKAAFLTVHVDRFFATHRVARTSAEFAALRSLNALANAAVPSLGNYIVIVIRKRPSVRAES